MIGLFTTALGRVISWLAGAGTMKWLVGAVIFFGIAFLYQILVALLPSWFDASQLTAGLSVLTPGMWYFVDYFRVVDGMGLILTALATRFLIRRIPGIG